MRQTLISEHFILSKQDPESHSQKHKKIHDAHLFLSLSYEHLPTLSHIFLPPQIPRQLSEKTVKILSSLNISSNSQSFPCTDDVLNTVSAREKFSDLLKNELQLPLPYTYKKLLNIQMCLDSNLNNARVYGVNISFFNLQNAIYSNEKLKIEQEHIQQILFLCPQLYTIYWKNHQLFVDLPESGAYQSFILHHRTQQLAKELYSRVKEFHKTHLNKSQLKFDPDSNKTWHSTFNLHDVPDIQLSPIPENPEKLKNPKISAGKQLRATRLMVLCRLLIKIFNRMQTPSLFMKSLIKLIQKEKWTLDPCQRIEADLIELHEIFENWIKFVNTESGKVVRVNKQAEFTLKDAWRKIKLRYYG